MKFVLNNINLIIVKWILFLIVYNYFWSNFGRSNDQYTSIKQNNFYYHPHMRVGNVFSHICGSVCLSACLSVCLSMCLSICVSICSGYNFGTTSHRHFILVCRYIFIISKSSLSIKVIGSRSRSYEKNDNFTCFNMFILCIWLQAINKVKVTHQCEGHIKVKVKYLLPFQFFVKFYLFQHINNLCVATSH